MPKPGLRNWQSAITVLATTVVGVVIVGALYWAQVILIPVALAVFLTFLLSPLVTLLHRRGLGRAPAVVLVMIFTIAVLGSLIWVVSAQVGDLAARLPEYNKNISAKVKLVSDRVEGLNQSLNRLLSPTGTADESGDQPAPQPAPAPRSEPYPWLSYVTVLLTPVAHGLGGGALALVLTGFMLIKREDMRNRLIRLAGTGRITATTRAMDETAQRITRFLLMQVVLNAVTGLAIGLGLLAIGVEYALLWGFLVFALRYVPYLGIWFAAVPPVLLSFAISDGWAQPLLAAGWIFLIEMIAGNVMEPYLFGHSIGVSEVSLLVSAAFWAFLWGPIGMVLSSPLTVCLVVLGRFHPSLKWLDVLLGDQPVLPRPVTFYQRLLARDQDEAEEIVQKRAEEVPPEKLYDELLIPALASARKDRESDDLPEPAEEFILNAVREIGEDLAEQMNLPLPPSIRASVRGEKNAQAGQAYVLACPAHDAEDEVALRLLEVSLDPTRWSLEVLSARTLGAELLSLAEDRRPELIVIASLIPGGLAHTRYLVKRLRARFPDVRLLVARWSPEPAAGPDATEGLRQAGADHVATTMEETRKQMQAWQPVLAESNGATATTAVRR